MGSEIEWLYVEHQGSDDHSYIDIFYYDGRGGLVGSVKKLSGVLVTESIMHRMLSSSHSESWYYQSHWIKDDFDAHESLSEQDLVLVLSDESLVSRTLIDGLERRSIPNEVFLNQSSLAQSFSEDEGFNTDVLETVLIDFKSRYDSQDHEGQAHIVYTWSRINDIKDARSSRLGYGGLLKLCQCLVDQAFSKAFSERGDRGRLVKQLLNQFDFCWFVSDNFIRASSNRIETFAIGG